MGKKNVVVRWSTGAPYLLRADGHRRAPPERVAIQPPAKDARRSA